MEIPGAPHEALFLALPYFSARELLAASEACSALRDAVQNDVVPWLHIVVERPLSWRLCDETLVRIASLARGKLRALSLVDCWKITDDGLQRVVDANPLISQLIIPGCTALTPEGVIKAVKSLQSKQPQTLKTLHINGLQNIQNHHIQSLITNPKQALKIDLEICPRCHEPRLVKGCPRGCQSCIVRCAECGGCVDELGDSVCGDVLCLICWLRLRKCGFCNKPYCKRHVEEEKARTSSSNGFVCGLCYAKFVEGHCFSDGE